MAIQGTLKTMSLTDLLQFVAAGRKTGTLKFDQGKVTKQVYFQKGLIVGSKSNDPKEYLGQVLLHYGKVTESQLQVAREVQRKSGGKLGEVLVEQGFLTEGEVLAILKTRTLEMIYDLFLWEDGQFQFYDEEPSPEDLTLIEVEPTKVIMEGIYRMDELARYRTLVPSDLAILELGPNWHPSLTVAPEVKQMQAFVEKRMCVAEICYNMHASSFHVYGQLFDLVSKGFARVAGELPERAPMPTIAFEEGFESVEELIASAKSQIDPDPEAAMAILQRVLLDEPSNPEAQELLENAEMKYSLRVYTTQLKAEAVPVLLVNAADLTHQKIGPQEGFVLSRINGDWDVQSIVSICPFREADCLRMMLRLIERGIVGI
jgi:Domain of unknown function (DUF4388)